MYQMTPWVTRLLIANVGIYFILSGLPPQLGNAIANGLVFRPGAVLQTPWTPVTYMFLHAGFGHLFGNMIGIFFFGPRLEQRLGAKGFLTLYFAAGMGGALFESILALFIGPVSMVGASGGVFGILAGFAYFWPRETILLFPIPIPIQAWLLVTLYVLWSLYAGLSSASIGGGSRILPTSVELSSRWATCGESTGAAGERGVNSSEPCRRRRAVVAFSTNARPWSAGSKFRWTRCMN